MGSRISGVCNRANANRRQQTQVDNHHTARTQTVDADEVHDELGGRVV
ncbi:hypothetical protein OCU_46160 [Mycobacterium intracellulare ATCC 13950]|uniref:Uncharacterized protein n=1 Tax=Mycobacterium intracellulare (strain ATCC 13950 / DSM 43223 / JCM 6384 / NCTC 13025 / 3600) TaxID=487521 RepID=H8IUH2_MYCIA|nr:hypothetical protein OCU_46160 [Mycobacterium intracellulare ATCC 13950]ETZ32242.1 hypothetical protein L843_4952 [Mycobacterium intracellulare MIN_061107_1834]